MVTLLPDELNIEEHGKRVRAPSVVLTRADVLLICELNYILHSAVEIRRKSTTIRILIIVKDQYYFSR